MSPRERKSPSCPNDCKPALDDHRERIAIRQDSPRREFSGRVVDHPSAPPRADPRVLQFRPHRRRHRRSCDAAARREARYLDLLEAELLGKGDTQAEAVSLRHALAERGMPPRHALDVLIAFRMDVTKLRYENWDEVIHYCRYSAMPVGRFMLDVHGESTSTWAASDALCAGLQINNHLQDCGKDFRELNRVYLPRDALAAAGASVEELGGRSRRRRCWNACRRSPCATKPCSTRAGR